MPIILVSSISNYHWEASQNILDQYANCREFSCDDDVDDEQYVLSIMSTSHSNSFTRGFDGEIERSAASKALDSMECSGELGDVQKIPGHLYTSKSLERGQLIHPSRLRLLSTSLIRKQQSNNQNPP